MVVGLIPCRKGSKRLPGKALLDLNGKPLLWYTLKAAEESDLECYVLTSDYSASDLIKAGIDLDEFSKLWRIGRPDQYCRDDSPYTDYIQHFLSIPREKGIDSVCLLQPTCPLRTSRDIDAALDIYERGSLPGLVSAYEVSKGLVYNDNFSSLFGTVFIKNEKVYVRNSSIYIFSISYFLNHKTIFANPSHVYSMGQFESVDINTEIDFKICEKLLNSGGE